MVNISQISERLAAYLNGCTEIDAFEDWIIANTWNVHLTDNSELMDLAYELEELLHEHSLLHTNEARLKEKLKDVLYSIKPQQNVIQVDLANSTRTFLNGEVMMRSQRDERRSGRDSWRNILQV